MQVIADTGCYLERSAARDKTQTQLSRHEVLLIQRALQTGSMRLAKRELRTKTVRYTLFELASILYIQIQNVVNS